MSYIYDEAGKFWRRPSHEGFAYSDGDAVENRLRAILSNATDRRVLSMELMEKITDWPTRYHLSPLRSNLLRPQEHLLKEASVLELGGGCGAITRYLGETCRQVTMVEGSPRRAAIAAARCLGLDNVRIYCDNILHADFPDAPYDVVTLIGVLEYARLFDAKSEDPIQTLLSKAKSLLSPSGVLILALENQLGLKYLAGEPEDHLNQPMAGVNDAYDERGIVTFGVAEMRRRLERAGFSALQQYLPLPDYKLPTAVVFPEARALSPERFDLAALLVENCNSHAHPNLHRLFSLERAWSVAVRNGLAWDLCNSLYFVASAEAQPPSDDPTGTETPLAVHYGLPRRPQFAKQTYFMQREQTIIVRRSSLYAGTVPTITALQSSFAEEEPYAPHAKYIDGFYAAVNKKHWTPAHIAQWQRSLLQSWESRSVDLDGRKMVPSSMMDCIAKNVIIGPDGHFIFIDQEWHYGNALIQLNFLVFYSLLVCFQSVGDVEQPSAGTPFGIWEISLLVMRELQLPFSEKDQEAFLIWLKKFHIEATGSQTVDSYKSIKISIRYTPGELLAYINSISEEIRTARAQISTLTRERDTLKKIVDKHCSGTPHP